MWRKFFGKYLDQIKTVYGRLSPSQRVTAGILGATVFLGLFVLAFFTNQSSYTALARHKQPGELQSMKARLEGEGFDVRVEDGVLKVNQNELHQALNYVAGEIKSAPKVDGWRWLDEDPKWGETSLRLKEKKRRALTIILEEAIKICPDIVDASLVLNVKDSNFSVLDTGDKGNSASLVVELAPGIGQLTNEQVRVIRNTVCGGAAIPMENISLTDDKLNEYHLDDGDGLGGMTAFDEKRMGYIKHYTKLIADFLSPPFKRDQFALVVDVKLSRRKVESESKTYKKPDPDDQLKKREVNETTSGTRRVAGGVPGVESNTSGANRLNATNEPAAAGGRSSSDIVDNQETTKEEVEYDTQFGHTLEKSSMPAGEIEDIAVSLRLDQDAVDRIRGSRTAEDYVTDRKSEISNLLKLHQKSVNVMVTLDKFVIPGDAPQETVEAKESLLGWLQSTAKNNVSLIAVFIIALGAMGFVYTLARKAIPPPIEIPSVELPEEPEEEEAEETETNRIIETLEENKDFVRNLQEVESLGRDNPNIIANVMRLWISRTEDNDKAVTLPPEEMA